MLNKKTFMLFILVGIVSGCATTEMELSEAEGDSNYNKQTENFNNEDNYIYEDNYISDLSSVEEYTQNADVLATTEMELSEVESASNYNKQTENFDNQDNYISDLSSVEESTQNADAVSSENYIIEEHYVAEFEKKDSLRHVFENQMKEFGYKVIWNSKLDVIFENRTSYKADDVDGLLSAIASDIYAMGVDLHFNLYTKNNVLVVYSVR
ncbi:MAG: TcpQ domain-containing protein [Vibrio sp.]